MNIELHQLVGKGRNNLGEVYEKKWNVDRVLRDGVQIGTIGRHKNARFCPLASAGIGRDEADDIVKEITKIRHESGAFGPPDSESAKTPTEPIYDTILRDDDEDEDE